MIGIIVALKKEANGLIDSLTEKSEFCLSGKQFYRGKFLGHEVIIALSGIGKVSAALSAQTLIDKFSPKYILNFGSVGGIKGEVEVLKYYAIEKCCQYDFDLSSLDNVKVGYMQDYDTIYFYPQTDCLDFLKPANLSTSDRFTEKPSDIETVKSLDCNLFDMEGAAIAQVCKSNDIPLYMIKGVTDTYGSGADINTFYQNLDKVCKGFDAVLQKFFTAKENA